jgi:hypothetical protein
VSRWTGIPVTKLDQEEKDKLTHLADRLRERVVVARMKPSTWWRKPCYDLGLD